jgi:hypothetical protein
MTSRRWAIVAAGLIAMALVAGIVTFTGGQQSAPRPSPSTPVASSPSGSAPKDIASSSPAQVPAVPAGFVEFRDEKTGFVVSYPKDWKVLKVPNDPQVSLLATLNQRDSFLVRVVPLGFQVGPNELPGMMSVTNQIVTSGKSTNVIAGPKQVQVGGLPGYFYLYTFMDGGQKGAHSHYFLFKGDKMITMVFQAIPEDQFQKQAPVFDQIANSFRVLPT